MYKPSKLWFSALFSLTLILTIPALAGDWVSRDHRFHLRGAWNWALSKEHPELARELNGIDFGHAHVAETLIETQDAEKVEKARLEVLDFILSSPPVAPDEAQIAPTYTRMAWEVQRAFDWAHVLHRSLYDLFASDAVADKDAAYRRIIADYLSMPEAITPVRLDHHGALWSFPESKSFRDKFPKFNSQIWAYHWLQAAIADVQLSGGAEAHRQLLPKIIAQYHEYLKNPPTEWQFMPMFAEVAPEFSARYPEAAAIFDNLHMLHDNFDDILSRPDIYPTLEAKRGAIIKILPIYLNKSHKGSDKFAGYHEKSGGHGAHHGIGARPPSVADVLASQDSGGDMKKPDGGSHEGMQLHKMPEKSAPAPAPDALENHHRHNHGGAK
ncbi:MAG: hypothetical protein ACT4NX_10160 [Deltaproteobacteria bacterium]